MFKEHKSFDIFRLVKTLEFLMLENYDLLFQLTFLECVIIFSCVLLPKYCIKAKKFDRIPGMHQQMIIIAERKACPGILLDRFIFTSTM